MLKDKKWVEEIVGVFLYYTHAFDPMMLLPIVSIASEKSTDTIRKFKEIFHHFMEYTATHLAVNIKYFARKIHL